MKLENLIGIILMGFFSLMVIYFLRDLFNLLKNIIRKIKVKKIIKNLEKEDIYWNYNLLKQNVEMSYLKIREVYSCYEVKKIKKLLSDNFYEDLLFKYEGYEKYYCRKEICNVNIRSISPIGLVNTLNNEGKKVWFEVSGTYLEFIISPVGGIVTGDYYEYDYFSIKPRKNQGQFERMIVNYINRFLYFVAQGNLIYEYMREEWGINRPNERGEKRFVEYIKLIRKENKWVVDELLDKERMKYSLFPIKI